MASRARKSSTVTALLASIGLVPTSGMAAATGDRLIEATEARADATAALKVASARYRAEPTAENLAARDRAEEAFDMAWDAAQIALEAHDDATTTA